MTSHEFAKQLLEGPNLPIRVPRVVEYDNEEGALEIPVIAQEGAIKDEDEYEEFEVLIISQNRGGVSRHDER